jgi:hypothetical protein
MTDPVADLHRELFGSVPTKPGTAYERLAALILREIDADGSVRHDVRLSGTGKRTKHQIDVSLRRDDNELKTIIECRYLFGQKGKKKITLGAARDFASVVRDLAPDEAWMLTTIGYTGPAETYANEQGIRLGILTARPQQGISRVEFRGQVGSPSDLTITQWNIVDDAERARVEQMIEDQATNPPPQRVSTHSEYFVDAAGKPTVSLFEVLDPIYQEIQRDLKEGLNQGTSALDKPRHILVGEVPVCVGGFHWEVELTYGRFDFTINLAKRIARLLLRMLDGSLDRRFAAGDLGVWAIDGEGNVIPR